MNIERTPAEKSSRSPQMERKPVARVGGVQCLRCQGQLESYVFTKLAFEPYSAGNVVIECPHCGHIELMSQSSPLLRRLMAKPAAVGDGD